MGEVKFCRGSWPMVFGLRRPATLAQTIAVLSAFGYDGIELGGIDGHASLERYPDGAGRRRLAEQLRTAGLQPVTLVPAPNGDAGRLPWSTGGDEVLAEYRRWFGAFLELAADLGIPGLRVDPGVPGPLPYGTEYQRVWDTVVRTFREHAELGAEVGCTMLWEAEPGQPFNKPSEVIQLVADVDHPNFKVLYDTSHFHQIATGGFNQVQPLELLEGGQIELIQRLAGSIGHVHICDTDGSVVENVCGTKLGIGKGIIDFDELIPALAAVYDGEWWSVDSVPMNAEAWADSYDDLIVLREMTHPLERPSA
jgi:sugar phosphate isomerase/epimerase